MDQRTSAAELPPSSPRQSRDMEEKGIVLPELSCRTAAEPPPAGASTGLPRGSSAAPTRRDTPPSGIGGTTPGHS
ncbi:unnamed protein product [Boreogadus saida]